MQLINIVLSAVAAYVLGAVPSGWLVVKLFNGKDIRTVASGRTGGTNALRAAGLGAGLLTAALDVLKGAGAVWLARWLVPGNVWIEVAAPLLAIMGHNYSVFLLEKNSHGKLKLRGGAGGAPCFGGALGLWPASIFFLLPLAGGIWYGVGYASVTTMSIALISTGIFAYRAWIGASPWAYVLYGVLAEVLLVWALRPNIKRLIAGTERLQGWRARKAQPVVRIEEAKSDEKPGRLAKSYEKIA